MTDTGAMTPPLQALRLRSIMRWLADQRPPPSSEERARLASELDDQMIQAFEVKEAELMEAMDQAGTMGTQAAMQTFRTDLLLAWEQVLADFLPTRTTDPDSEN